MSTRPVYAVDEQKRVTLGALVEPGTRFIVAPEGERIVLTPSLSGRVKVDGRRRLPLGRSSSAGAMYRADARPDGSIVLSPLMLVDPSEMPAELVEKIRPHLAT